MRNNLVSVVIGTNSISVTCRKGWYLVESPLGRFKGLKVWMHLNDDITKGGLPKTGGEYYVYNETSSTSSNGEVVWLRTPSITVSTGDYIKLAYLAATSSSGGTTTANTMWFFWA